MAFDLSILAQPLAHKSNRGDFNLVSTIQNNRIISEREKQNEIANKRNADNDKLSRKLTNLQISEAQRKIAGLKKVDSTTDYAGDIIRMTSLVKNGDPESIEALLTDRVSRLEARNQAGEDVNSDNSAALLRLLKTDPERFGAVLASENDLLTQTGFIKTGKVGQFSAVTKIFKNGTIIQADPNGGVQVRNQRNEIVEGDAREQLLREAYEAENDGTKSKEEVQQMMELATFKANLATTPEERRLNLERLQQQIAATKLDLAAGEENVRKGEALKTTAMRLVNQLLDNPDGVRSLVGPYDQSAFSFTFLDDTLRARTDYTQLTSILTADNLKLMTGVLSETDIKIIAAIAGGGLDVNGEDDAFLDELDRMRVSLGQEKSNTLNFDAQGNQI